MINKEDCIIPVVTLTLTTMLRFSLCDYSDAYILVKGTITFIGERDDVQHDKQMKEIKV